MQDKHGFDLAACTSRSVPAVFLTSCLSGLTALVAHAALASQASLLAAGHIGQEPGHQDSGKQGDCGSLQIAKQHRMTCVWLTLLCGARWATLRTSTESFGWM